MKTLKEFYDDLSATFEGIEDEHEPISGADMVDYICDVVKGFEFEKVTPVRDLNQCPHCKGRDLDFDGAEFDGDFVFQRAKCNGCNKAWYDKYAYTNLEPIEMEKETK